ncbi:MAG: NAD-dependent epimerase/dehydratase family protein [Clostridia bacterium]|nr:NAD-dependent epimerase/dehydratase family protein [Deltaproteobacteria bacterium]
MCQSLAIIGARGFIGRRLVARYSSNCRLVLFGREDGVLENSTVRRWSPSAPLKGCSAVIHLAADASTLSTDYRGPNVDLPLEVLEASAKEDVRRFVFVSSIFVHGRASETPLTPSSPFAPEDGYARSKIEAERALTKRSCELGIELVIVRPPLVYGLEARNTFALLRKLVVKHVPLPLGRAKAKRSIIAVDNLVDCLLSVATAEHAIACILPADDADYSLQDLVRMMSAASGKRALNLPFPKRVLRRALTLLGRRHIYDQLFCSLCVDRAHWFAVPWSPKLATENAIAQEMS